MESLKRKVEVLTLENRELEKQCQSWKALSTLNSFFSSSHVAVWNELERVIC
jgi:hypothetical protein